MSDFSLVLNLVIFYIIRMYRSTRKYDDLYYSLFNTSTSLRSYLLDRGFERLMMSTITASTLSILIGITPSITHKPWQYKRVKQSQDVFVHHDNFQLPRVLTSRFDVEKNTYGMIKCNNKIVVVKKYEIKNVYMFRSQKTLSDYLIYIFRNPTVSVNIERFMDKITAQDL